MDQVEKEQLELASDKELEVYLSTDALKDFLRILKNYSTPNQEENLKLFNSYKNGDPKARELLINKNIRLVISQAFRNNAKLHSYEKLDLIQDGIIGLMRAIDTYDETKGYFSTYAYIWIRQSMNTGLFNNDSEIRRPTNFLQAKNKYLTLVSNYEKEGKPLPSKKEICEILSISDEVYKLIRRDSILETSSLSQKLSDDEETTLEEFLGFEDEGYTDTLDEQVDRELMVFLKLNLSKRDYYILYHRILSPDQLRLDAISKKIEVTKERIRQIEKSLILKVRKYYDDRGNFIGCNSSDLSTIVDVQNFRTDPIEPDNIIKYLFVKDHLDEEEKFVAKEILFGTHKNCTAIMDKLSIDEQICKNLIAHVLRKIKHIIDNKKESFERFATRIKKEHASKIFEVNLEMDVSAYLIDPVDVYDYWKEKSYEDLLHKLGERGVSVPIELEDKLKTFFNAIEPKRIDLGELEMRINLALFGLDKSDDIPSNDLRKFFLEHRDKFSIFTEYMLLKHFGLISDDAFKEKYPNVPSDYPKTRSLEKLYSEFLQMGNYRNYNLDREMFLSIRKKVGSSVDACSLHILDEFYGLNTGNTLSHKELATVLNAPLDEAKDKLRVAKRRLLSAYTDTSVKISLDLDIYKKYLEEHDVDFNEPMKSIVNRFIVEKESYEELSREYGIRTSEVSTHITNALWKIDSYRFGFSTRFPFSTESLLKVLKNSMTMSQNEKEYLEEYIICGDSSRVCKKYAIQSNVLPRKMSKLYGECTKFFAQNVTLSHEEIAKYVTLPHYSNILNQKEREVLSLLYQVECVLNPEGKKCDVEQVASIMGLKKGEISRIACDACDKLKARKSGELKIAYTIDSIHDLDAYVLDPKTPLLDSYREVLTDFYGLNGTTPKTFDSINEKTKIPMSTLKMRLLHGLIIIKRYQNGEIPGFTVFDEDVKPYLKYFTKSDQQVLMMHYKEGLLLKEIAQKLGKTEKQAGELLFKLKVYLNKLQDGYIGFDFDYFWKSVYDEDIPFYGDLDLAIELFQLYYEKDVDIPEIITVYHPELKNEDIIRRYIFCIMMATQKRKMGIKKTCPYSYEDVRDYYLSHHEGMTLATKKIYYRYFQKMKSGAVFSKNPISKRIVDDLLKEEPGFIRLSSLSDEAIKKLIDQHKDVLGEQNIEYLLGRTNILPRDYMKGRDKKQVLDFLISLNDLDYRKNKKL